MITRIVKMTFNEDETKKFLAVFHKHSNQIRNFNGCEGLILLRDINNSNIFFTYSHWLAESDLENYRNSELFANVWETVKKYFSAKPEAWSCETLYP